MTINWVDAVVQAAVIESIGGVLAAIIAAIAASIIGHKIADRKRLQTKIEMLQEDVFFLLAVEEKHCQRHGQKIAIRNQVRKEGHAWSGKHTPGRAKNH